MRKFTSIEGLFLFSIAMTDSETLKDVLLDFDYLDNNSISLEELNRVY